MIAADDREDAITAETVRRRRHRARTPSGGTTRIVQNRLGIVSAAAGVDASNTPHGTVLLLPVDPDASARALATGLRLLLGVEVGVIVSDTLGRAWREGQTDSAIGAGGVHVFEDLRGQTDAEGRPLVVTMPCVADEIAAAADLVKGKASRTAGRGRARTRRPGRHPRPAGRAVDRARSARARHVPPRGRRGLRRRIRRGRGIRHRGLSAPGHRVRRAAPYRDAAASAPLTLPNSRAIGASTSGRAATQPATMTMSDAAKIQNPTQLIGVLRRVHVVQVAQRPGREHQRDVDDDERDEVEHHREVHRPRPLHRVDPVQGLGVLGPDPATSARRWRSRAAPR